MTTLHEQVKTQIEAMGRVINVEVDRMRLEFDKNVYPMMGSVLINGRMEFDFFCRADGGVGVYKAE